MLNNKIRYIENIKTGEKNKYQCKLDEDGLWIPSLFILRGESHIIYSCVDWDTLKEIYNKLQEE